MVVGTENTSTNLPTAPLLNPNNPPVLDGTKVTAIWQPPVNLGADPDGLYFEVYVAQLEKGESPIFCRWNKEPIDSECRGGTECRYEITGLSGVQQC
jgi:hypothetical protein